MTLAMLDADRAVAPTECQASTFPEPLRRKIDVVHEGVDTSLVQPSAHAEIRLRREGLALRPGDEVVTFVNRNLEPHRGFHIFMRALPQILHRRPNAHAIIVGGSDTSYGPPPAQGKTWKQVMLAEVGERLDLARVHFVGRLPYRTLIQLTSAIEHYGNLIVTANVDGIFDKRGLPDPLVLAFYFSFHGDQIAEVP